MGHGALDVVGTNKDEDLQASAASGYSTDPAPLLSAQDGGEEASMNRSEVWEEGGGGAGPVPRLLAIILVAQIVACSRCPSEKH